MPENYKYLCTQIGTSTSLPTHKVFVSGISRTTKLVFADNTFMYGIVSEWALNHSGLDSRKLAWSEEPKSFLESEKIRLSRYKALHPNFVTKSGTD